MMVQTVLNFSSAAVPFHSISVYSFSLLSLISLHVAIFPCYFATFLSFLSFVFFYFFLSFFLFFFFFSSFLLSFFLSSFLPSFLPFDVFRSRQREGYQFELLNALLLIICNHVFFLYFSSFYLI